MKTLFNSTYAKGCVNLCSERNIVGTMSEVDEVPFSVELLIDIKYSFYKILLEAIDDADPVANKKRAANSQKKVSKNDLQTL